MSRHYQRLPFRIGATSMVFGEDLSENVRILSDLVDHVEIVLFHTPTLHNIPGPREIRILKKIGEEKNVTFTVHLPASLEIASPRKRTRCESVQLTRDLFAKTSELNPLHYILHIPFSPPTLVPVPGLYFTKQNPRTWDEWTSRTLDSLETLHEEIGGNNTLLVENINYSPSFLEPFWKRGLCGLCLDLGHLILGKEKVLAAIRHYIDVIKVIHIHGVRGYKEHLSLSVLPEKRVLKWLEFLTKVPFKGVILLEVFTPQDLKESTDIVFQDSQY
ncbi:MAG: cobamide remodeling phosphodiesterase CbiR [Pseudomonadota bacterium]